MGENNEAASPDFWFWPQTDTNNITWCSVDWLISQYTVNKHQSINSLTQSAPLLFSQTDIRLQTTFSKSSPVIMDVY